MKTVFAVLISFVLLSYCSAQTKTDKSKPTSQKDKISYAIGVSIAKDFKARSIDINSDIFVRGMKDVLTGKKLLLTEKETEEIMMAFQQEMMEKQQKKMQELAAKNKKEGEEFLAQNTKKEGITTLPNGIQYKVITEGSGKTPTINDTVTVHYKGTLINGTEFDNSYKRGEPTIFPVKGVIAGWTEVLQLMKSGSKWEVFIPANLAYGEQGIGTAIEPNATLIFEIELLGVK